MKIVNFFLKLFGFDEYIEIVLDPDANPASTPASTSTTDPASTPVPAPTVATTTTTVPAADPAVAPEATQTPATPSTLEEEYANNSLKADKLIKEAEQLLDRNVQIEEQLYAEKVAKEADDKAKEAATKELADKLKARASTQSKKGGGTK